MLPGFRFILWWNQPDCNGMERNGMEWNGNYPNLVGARTFSKAFCLAGARVGYGIASPELIHALKLKTMPQWNSGEERRSSFDS